MRLISFVLAAITIFTCLGQDNVSDSVKVYFRVGNSQYDPAFNNNREAMDTFMNILTKAYVEGDIEEIVIRGSSSPDGTNKVNQRLSRLRCDAIADYIVSHLEIKPSLIRKIPEGIAWAGLRELVEKTPDVPSRDAVINILDNTPVWVFDSNGKVIDGRKRQLMSLDRGVPYRWMLTNLFPQLRNGVVVSIIMKETPQAPEPDDSKDSKDSTDIKDSKDISPSDPTEPTEPTELPVPPAEVKECVFSNFALKTNLLYYAVLMPNIQLEWMFHKRWSAAIETEWAWYAKNTPHKVYRVGAITPEVRYWVINRSDLHGLYVGALGGIGLYDICNGKTGHEGEFWMAGVSVGYMWPISKYLSLDAGIGAGYLRARDKVYTPLDGHFLYQYTKNVNYFGPLMLRLSLAWRIPKCKFNR